MIKVTCNKCGEIMYRSPSKVEKRNYCSLSCYSFVRNKEIIEKGKKYQFYTGNKRPKKWTESQTKKVSGEKNYAWKGGNVGYVGLHQWVRRNLGKPTRCSKCGKQSKKPRIIQWANIDGKYRRDLNDFIPLCCSCHKLYDIAIRATLGS